MSLKGVVLDDDDDDESDDDLSWYIVLVSFVPPKPTTTTVPGVFDIETKNNPKNRTVIYGSWAPIDVLDRMNNSGEENIHTAATKACEASLSYCHSDLPVEAITHPSIPTTYGIICILGPVKGRRATKYLVSMWDGMSRGQHPRTITGYMLANHFGLGFSINLPLFFQLDPNEVRIDVHRYSMDSGIDLSVTPLKEKLSLTAISTRRARAPPKKRPVPGGSKAPPAKRKNL